MYKRALEIINKYRTKVNKYYFTTALFAGFIFFFGDSTIFHRFKYNQKISELRSQISSHREDIVQNEKKINSLHMDNESLERYAREQYLMTKPNEDLYIITP